jgi:hypothetical protein
MLSTLVIPKRSEESAFAVILRRRRTRRIYTLINSQPVPLPLELASPPLWHASA